MNKSITQSDFPIEALPIPMKDLCKSGMYAFKLPYEFFALPSLIAVSTAIGSNFRLKVNGSMITKANLYACLIANSGSGKTPSSKIAMEPLHRYQQELYISFNKVNNEYKKKISEYNDNRKEAKKDNRKFEDSPPEKPLIRDVFTTDATTEALSVLLEKNPEGLMLEQDEFLRFYNLMDAYKNGKGGDRDFYMSLWSNQPIKINRKKEGDVYVPSPYLSIYGNMTPSGIKEIAKDHNTENGFLDRILFAYPTELGLMAIDRVGIDKQTETNYHKLIYDLLCFDEEITYELSDEAYDAYTEFHRQLSTWSGLHEKRMSISAKILSYSLRFALIIQSCEYYSFKAFGASEIDKETMNRGILLAQFFLKQQMKIYETIQETEEDKNVKKAITVIKKYHNPETLRISKREIQMNIKLSGDELIKFIKLLETKKIIAPVEESSKKEYAVNPEVLKC